MKAEQIVRRTIQEHDLISSGDTVILGLSGGPDSLCLLHVLAELRGELNFSLSCVHLNHLMRAEKATEDVDWLKSHCLSLTIPLSVSFCDVQAMSKEEKISVEEAGRRARHSALFVQALELRKKTSGRVLIALAHNKDDQAETVLMRTLRGTGIHGLAAMEYIRADGIIRPLLDTSRESIEEYCFCHNLSPRWDSTNASREYTRNRIRLDLIPLLEKEYNPNLKDGLARLSANAREDDAFLEKLARDKIAERSKLFEAQINTKSEIEYSLSELAANDPALGKRIIKLVFMEIGLSEDIGYVHFAALWSAIKNGAQGTIEFPQGFKAIINRESIKFCRQKELQAKSSQECKHWILCKKWIQIADMIDPKTLPYNQKAFDAKKVGNAQFPLELRTRIPGDHIQPLGFSGTKKLQDYFVDAKIDKDLRDSIPLVCLGSEILWVLNGPISEKYKITEETQTAILLDIQEEIC